MAAPLRGNRATVPPAFGGGVLFENRTGRLPIRAAVLSALALVACGGGQPAAPSGVPAPIAAPPPPRVLILSIDGLRPDALDRADTPNIDALVARGSYTWLAQTINPSNTLPAHVSMLTGVNPGVHKVTWDDYLPDKGRLSVPTVFTAVKAAGKRTAMVVGKQKFLTIKDAGSVDSFVLATRGDDDVANEAILQVDAGFDLVFVHFPDVDLIGHAQQWLSAQYLQKMQGVDLAIGRILGVVPYNMTVILTADHGGSNKGHGTTAAVHMTIPWLIAGPRIKPANALAVRVNTTDTAVTTAYILGVKLSDSVNGRVVTEAFTDR